MTEERAKRKLAAIFSADVKGYSRLMGEDEVSTVRTLKEYRELMSKVIRQYRGRVVDSPGDNVLAEFASVVDALECSIDTQKMLKEKNAALPDNRKMEFRIGVNLGDVIEDEDRVYGDGVNIAARIESLADPGGICISGSGFEQVRNKLPLGYEYLGEHSVKNIVQPIKVYRVLTDPESAGKVIGEKGPTRTQWRWAAVGVAIILVGGALALWNSYFRPPPIEPASEEKMAFPLPEKPSIAVLPFLNMSDDPKQEFFSDGISEEIITALSKTPKMLVIARNSTFSYKGKAVKMQQIAEELGVRYVLEGSVRKSADRIRITAQLIDAVKGHHLWADRYDRDLKDIFAIQDEITKEIITALQVHLTEGEQAGIYARGTTSLEAYLKTMEAKWLYMQSTKEGVLKARRLAEEAIALDSKYAFAYKTLGTTHGIAIQIGISKNPQESLKLAIELHRKAIELDDSFAFAHTGLGFFLLYARQYDAAIAEGRRGFELEPNSADVIMGYGGILTFAGRPEEAIPLYREAFRLNPKPPTIYFRFFGIALRDLGKYEDAIAQAKKAVEQEPDDLISLVLLTSSYSLAGQDEEARAASKEVLRISPNFSVGRFEKVTPHKDRAVTKRFCDALRKVGLPE